MKTLELFGTLGPSCADTEILAEMIREGMTGIRLNLSHASLEEADVLIKNYQTAAALCGVKPELLIDLEGPTLRIGELKSPIELPDGAELLLVEDDYLRDGVFLRQPEAAPKGLPMVQAAEYILRETEAGDHVLFDDGAIEAEVTEAAPAWARLRILRGGTLRSRKNIKIVDKTVSGPAVREQDVENLRRAREYGVTSVMLPFVRSARDLRALREAMEGCGCPDLRVFAKIENREGAEHIEEILPEADMIVIARGDLGNDVPLWELPKVQKELSAACRKAGRPFLVVTQLLYSMIERPVPTRAEVSDIYNAVLDGAAALMLTNETAAGKYPAAAMRYLRLTSEEAGR